MKQTLSEDLITISTLMMVAKERSEIIHLAGELNSTISKAMEIERISHLNFPTQSHKTLSTTIKFTKKEIDNMSKTFKKEFIAHGMVARIIKRPSGKNGFYYEIRYRRNGYNITVSNKDLKIAKTLFIEKTKELNPPEEYAKNRLKFDIILSEWLKYKKGKIAKSTIDGYKSMSDRFINEELRNKNINEIRTADIDEAMPDFEEYPRRYEDLRTIFNGVFKYAIASGIITYNPVALIPFRRAERIPRIALTNEQIISFLTKLQNERYEPIRQCAYVLYFFGLRPCEIDHETHFENGFLISRNRKRKNGKIEYKKIPVPKQTQGLIDFEKPIAPKLSYDRWLDLMEEILPNNFTPYNLRHTFATKCSEPAEIKPEIIDLWMEIARKGLSENITCIIQTNFYKKK